MKSMSAKMYNHRLRGIVYEENSNKNIYMFNII